MVAQEEFTGRKLVEVTARDLSRPVRSPAYAWRRTWAVPTLLDMQFVRRRSAGGLARSLAIILALAALPASVRAQSDWTGIGAISGTVMYMDTTTIMRDGAIRKVWIKSFDLDPKTVVVGKDTLTFDTVIGLNVFDCSKGTRTVAAVQYLLGEDIVLDVAETHGKPELLRPKSFFAAIYADVCKESR